MWAIITILIGFCVDRGSGCVVVTEKEKEIIFRGQVEKNEEKCWIVKCPNVVAGVVVMGEGLEVDGAAVTRRRFLGTQKVVFTALPGSTNIDIRFECSRRISFNIPSQGKGNREPTPPPNLPEIQPTYGTPRPCVHPVTSIMSSTLVAALFLSLLIVSCLCCAYTGHPYITQRVPVPPPLPTRGLSVNAYKWEKQQPKGQLPC
eukprot:TRINITY_DN11203_c0_g2_i1.p1 TRINITY_DN11203_c0_g2~~TRINITY_DN11203_c0_g2_i1.p1  ORF type:complete len:233 (+),score=16.08 TRINITY_DN11203_c0_g2_i1:91-699(+)